MRKNIKNALSAIAVVFFGYAGHASAQTYNVPAKTMIKPSDGGTFNINFGLGRGPKNPDPYTPLGGFHIQNFGVVDSGNIIPDTLLMGGTTWSDKVFIKATCQNVSQGDEGGVCYEFDDVSGPTYWHRNGSGAQDGINVGMVTQNAAPIVMLGGNQIYRDSNGNVTAIENRTTLASATAASSTSMVVTGPLGCGNPDGKQYCDITVKDTTSGNVLYTGSFFGSATNFNYNNGTTTITLATAPTVALPSGASVVWHVYGADGVAYGVDIGQNWFRVVPAPSPPILSMIRARMATYTNIAAGMSSTEHVDYHSDDRSAIDHPNFYFGYYSSSTPDGGGTKFFIETRQYPGTGARYAWRDDQFEGPIPYSDVPSDYTYTLKTAGSFASGTTDIILSSVSPDQLQETSSLVTGDPSIPAGTTGTMYWNSLTNTQHMILSNALTATLGANVSLTLKAQTLDGTGSFKPGNMTQDSYDYQITYTGDDGNTYHNSNTHAYPANAVFMGMVYKNFNTYWMQGFADFKDSITRDFDNELDFWTGGSHPAMTSSRGMTLVWSGGNAMAQGSWMMRLAGTNLMPLGLSVDGVFPWGGRSIQTDAGFMVMRTSSWLPTNLPTDPHTATMLGMTTGINWDFHQLSWFENADDGAHTTNHLGDIQSTSGGLQYNRDAACRDISRNSQTNLCTTMGQILFNPNGNQGVGLGWGMGSTMTVGLLVNPSGDVSANGSLTVASTIGSIAANKTYTTQGLTAQWNATTAGEVDLVSVGAGSGGFNLYAASQGAKLTDTGTQLLFSVNRNGASLSKYLTMAGAFSSGPIGFAPQISLDFATGSADSNNTFVHMYYSMDYDQQGAVFFTNFHYGDIFLFNGEVRVMGRFGWDGGTKGVDSKLAMGFSYDSINHAVVISTDKFPDSGIEYQSVTYANLGTPTVSNIRKYCTDCYTAFRAQGDTQTGVDVVWNGQRWNDMVGVAILH